MRYQYHKDGTVPNFDENDLNNGYWGGKRQWIWVFGSNLYGIHGSGAAKVAKDDYGAVLGHGIGRMGNAYAIPTVRVPREPLSLLTIEQHVIKFLYYTYEHTYTTFWVTRVGCGLAGFTDEQIAPFFRGANLNCNFPEEWKPYLEI